MSEATTVDSSADSQHDAPVASATKQELALVEGAGRLICGTNDENLRMIERAFGVDIGVRGDSVRIVGPGPSVTLASSLFQQLSDLVRVEYRLKGGDVRTAIRVVQDSPEASLVEFFQNEGLVATATRLVAPRSLNQKRYIRAMLDHDLVVSVGPAGTGKTYLAVAMAAASLMEQRIKRIVLARPAVEAGEKLGFLPGDLADKVNPYLRPLYDALYDILGFDKVTRMMEREIIEVAPLAFMRGRTLNDAFIILDEAQNTTPEQMKMFLTRIGFNSKAVVNGDVTQIDLPSGRESGLKQAQHILRDTDGIAFVSFSKHDVVRHELVQRIVSAYARYEESKESEEPSHSPD